ncbi:hypothetical protein [Thalassotalea aquiviva]|uniref:hypothetical protein n=1 Tax=Thalassotalea aquiviva TaxID=3242415 RepID=UPI00352B6901
MKELNLDEVQAVTGGISQEGAIGTNISIVGIGVAIAVAGSAPAWFPITMIGLSIVTTSTYIYKSLAY